MVEWPTNFKIRSRSSFIEVIFQKGCLLWWSSSIEIAFHGDHHPLKSTSIKVVFQSSTVVCYLPFSTCQEFSFPMYSGLFWHIQNSFFSNVFWIIWTHPEFYFPMYSGLSGHVQNFIFQCILDYLDASRLLFSNDFWKFLTCPDT